MVTPDLNADGYTGHILIEPNRPISWQDNIRFVRIFALLSLLVGGALFYQGLYLILPFSGLEVACLFGALYLVYRHYSICQVIYFTRDSVIIESGDKRATERVEYQRFLSTFYIDDNGNYSIPRLTIRSHGKTTEIGSFLSYADKQALISLIRKLTQHFQQVDPQATS